MSSELGDRQLSFDVKSVEDVGVLSEIRAFVCPGCKKVFAIDVDSREYISVFGKVCSGEIDDVQKLMRYRICVSCFGKWVRNPSGVLGDYLSNGNAVDELDELESLTESAPF